MGKLGRKKQPNNSRPVVSRTVVTRANRRPSPGVVNWLKETDKAAPGKRRYGSWFEFGVSAFDVVRYPFLRPQKPPQDSPDRSLVEAEEELFKLRHRLQEAQLAEETPEAVAGLTSEQRSQLVALMWDCETNIKLHSFLDPMLAAQDKIAREGEHRVKMLRRKLEKVVQGLEDLRDYASRMDSQYGFKELPAHVRLCLLALDKFKSVQGLADKFAECRELGEDPRKGCLRSGDPKSRCMVHLYWFFREGCSLSGDEAEVRVAIIRNTFWKKLGVEPVDYVDAYDRIQNKGCTAVRQAVARYR